MRRGTQGYIAWAVGRKYRANVKEGEMSYTSWTKEEAKKEIIENFLKEKKVSPKVRVYLEAFIEFVYENYGKIGGW